MFNRDAFIKSVRTDTTVTKVISLVLAFTLAIALVPFSSFLFMQAAFAEEGETGLPALITITAASAEKVYDGEALISDSYTVEPEIEGLSVFATVAGEEPGLATETVSSPNVVVPESVMVMFNGEDVTGQIEVILVSGTLTVTVEPTEPELQLQNQGKPAINVLEAGVSLMAAAELTPLSVQLIEVDNLTDLVNNLATAKAGDQITIVGTGFSCAGSTILINPGVTLVFGLSNDQSIMKLQGASLINYGSIIVRGSINISGSVTFENHGDIWLEEGRVYGPLNLTEGTAYDLLITYFKNDGSAIRSNDSLTGTGIDRLVVKDHAALADFERPGYEFTGWNTAPDGTGKLYNPGDEYLFNIAAHDRYGLLFAQWTPVPQTLIYKGNGATVGMMDSETHNTDSVFNLTHNNYGKKGYTFLGWSLDPKATTPTWTDQASFTMLAPVDEFNTTTLFAVWEAVTYKVSYVVSGAAPAMFSPSLPFTTSYQEDDTVAALAGLSTTSNMNGTLQGSWEFSGWKASPSVTITSGMFTMPASDVAFTGFWTFVEDPIFTVTFDPGTQGAFAPVSHNVYAASATPAAPFAAANAGYLFEGWSPEVDTTVTKSVTYTAQWRAGLVGYTVRHHDATTGAILLEDNGLLALTGEDAVAEPETFDGYAHDPSDARTVASGTVAGDGSLILALYYAPVAPPEVIPEPQEPPADPVIPAPVVGSPLIVAEVAAVAEIPFVEDPTANIPSSLTPQSSAPIQASEVPFGAPTSWALLNLVLTAMGVLLAVIMLIVPLLRLSRDKEYEVSLSKLQRRRIMWAVISLIAGSLAAVLFFITQDITLPMGLVDSWTVIHVAIFAAQIALLVAAVFSRRGEQAAAASH
ncbi:MAG: InlB B-repeat-containing protein [Coriobacteriales bacterium]|jgi:hypothetical protein|nr:InlB B-repeat-containing protein [Coriobacteriales bacterium]